MPIRSRQFAVLALGLAACLAGCEFISYKPKGTSPLLPLQLTADSAELEIVFVRSPAGDHEMADLWSSIDEQAIPSSLRSELAANGLRAGIIRGQTPAPLAHKLTAAEDHVWGLECSQDCLERRTGRADGVRGASAAGPDDGAAALASAA